MVFLTMTTAMVEALEKVQTLTTSEDRTQELGTKEVDVKESLQSSNEREAGDQEDEGKARITKTAESLIRDGGKEKEGNSKSAEPSLSDPKVGNPISHGQVIDLSNELKSRGISPRTLDVLLRGAGIYVPPPKPKPKPTSEYKTLMARLRAEEEARSYERMTNPPAPVGIFSQRFPMSSSAHAFASSEQPTDADDEVTYQDVDRQMALIFNVLISIVACAGAIWMAARWWSTPTRLALSMSGSILVGVAEVVVYSGYIRRVGEAKGKAKELKEVKEIINTWIVGGEDDADELEGAEIPVTITEKDSAENSKVRKRK